MNLLFIVSHEVKYSILIVPKDWGSHIVSLHYLIIEDKTDGIA